MVISILAGIVTAFIMPIMEILELCGVVLPCVKGKGVQGYMTVHRIKRGVGMALKLIQMPIFATCLSTANKVLNDYSKLNSVGCLSASTSLSAVYSDVNTETGVIKSGDTQTLILSIIFIIFDIAVIVYEEKKHREALQKLQNDPNGTQYPRN